MSLDELAPNVTSSSDEDNLGSILSNRKLSHNPEVYSGNSVRVQKKRLMPSPFQVSQTEQTKRRQTLAQGCKLMTNDSLKPKMASCFRSSDLLPGIKSNRSGKQLHHPKPKDGSHFDETLPLAITEQISQDSSDDDLIDTLMIKQSSSPSKASLFFSQQNSLISLETYRDAKKLHVP